MNITIVAFDMDNSLLFFKDGVLWTKLHYTYNLDKNLEYRHFLPFLKDVFPEADCFHLSFPIFRDWVETQRTWSYKNIPMVAEKFGTRLWGGSTGEG